MQQQQRKNASPGRGQQQLSPQRQQQRGPQPVAMDGQRGAVADGSGSRNPSPRREAAQGDNAANQEIPAAAAAAENAPAKYPKYENAGMPTKWFPRETEQLLLTDLDAFNYISATLFNEAGAERKLISITEADRKKVYRDELLADFHLFDLLYRPELLPRPASQRVQVAVALLAIEEIQTLRSNYEVIQTDVLRISQTAQRAHEGEDVRRNRATTLGLELGYDNRKRTAVGYRNLIRFLCSGAIPLSEKKKRKVFDLCLAFKTAVFFAEMEAGNYDNTIGQHSKIKSKQSRLIAQEVMKIEAGELNGFEKADAGILEKRAKDRLIQLLQDIDSGSVIPNATNKEEDDLLQCLESVTIQANTTLLPVLHPKTYEDVCARDSYGAALLLEKLRTSRATTLSRLDVLGISPYVGGEVVAAGEQAPAGEAAEEGAENDANANLNIQGERKRKKWSLDEDKALEDGLRKHGAANNPWVKIKESAGDILSGRDTVQIKDRARTLRNQRDRQK